MKIDIIKIAMMTDETCLFCIGLYIFVSMFVKSSKCVFFSRMIDLDNMALQLNTDA